jgi:hypothetical protein
MKTATCFLLSFAILFVGCYTQSPITKEEGVPNDSKVFFYLKDGSYVESFADSHQRVEGGYQVSGTITRRGNYPEKFDGMILHTDVDRLGVIEFSGDGSLLAVGVITLGVIVWVTAAGVNTMAK